MAGSRTKKKCYLVMRGREPEAKTWAVSEEKAINNVRYNRYISQGIYEYAMDDLMR